MPTRIFSLVVVVSAATLVTCCDSTGADHAGLKTLTGRQVADRAEDYVRRAATALPPLARLELHSADTIPCDDPSGHSLHGRVTAGQSYWVRDLPKAGHPRYFDAMLDWWSKHGFFVLTDDRPGRNYVSVQNEQDGFRMALRETPDGGLLLGADSPCVWPHGTPVS